MPTEQDAQSFAVEAALNVFVFAIAALPELQSELRKARQCSERIGAGRATAAAFDAYVRDVKALTEKHYCSQLKQLKETPSDEFSRGTTALDGGGRTAGVSRAGEATARLAGSSGTMRDELDVHARKYFEIIESAMNEADALLLPKQYEFLAALVYRHARRHLCDCRRRSGPHVRETEQAAGSHISGCPAVTP